MRTRARSSLLVAFSLDLPFIAIALTLLLLGLSRAALAEKTRITFYEHIVPILEGHCVVCHRPNEMAPMSLIQYEEVRPWAKAIKREVVARRMPPFHADGPIGLWRDDPRLSDDQIETISSWVDSGAPRGTLQHMRETQTLKATKWPLGQPDLIIPFRPYVTPGNGEDQHVFLVAKYSFDQETWIESIQWSIRNKRILHHASLRLLLIPEEIAKYFHGMSVDSNALRVNQEFSEHIPMSLYLPGSKPYRFPAQRALRFPEDSGLVIVAHYAPTDQKESDTIEVGLTFADGPYWEYPLDARLVKSTLHVIKNSGRELREILDIPPHAENYSLKAERLVTEDSILWGGFAHMHLRGKSFGVTAYFPDETHRSLFRVSSYSFDWQRLYLYVDPVILPKGTRLEYEWVWDNSASNPHNPNPDVRVRFGGRTIDEMPGGAIMVSPLQEHQDPIALSRGMRRK